MDYDDKFKEKINLDVDDAIGVCNDLLDRHRNDEKAKTDAYVQTVIRRVLNAVV